MEVKLELPSTLDFGAHRHHFPKLRWLCASLPAQTLLTSLKEGTARRQPGAEIDNLFVA